MVHIKSSDDYAWQEDLYDRVGCRLGEKMKAGAIDGVYVFTEQIVPNLDHLDMTLELAGTLST